MEKKSQENERKRKALLVMPLIVIPFLTMAFWALGGGTDDAHAQSKTSTSGLNLQLPSAHLQDDKGANKLSFYDQADKDTLKWKADLKNDPLYNPYTGRNDALSSQIRDNQTFPFSSFPLQGVSEKDPNEEKVYQKLAELNQQLHASQGTFKPYKKEQPQVEQYSNVHSTTEAERSPTPVKHYPNEDQSSVDDPELKQLNGMMDKILDIQHPERIRQRMNNSTSAQKLPPLPVDPSIQRPSISMMDTNIQKQVDQYGFYPIEGKASETSSNAIEAAIEETQTLTNGSTVKLRLLSNLSIKGSLIPKGNLFFGIASLNGERLSIEVPSIRMNNMLFPVHLKIYDLDGLEGVYIPNAITRDVAKNSVDQASQMLELSSLDPSLKAQAASAGISALKTLVSKKVKLTKVAIKAGYKVLLYNQQN